MNEYALTDSDGIVRNVIVADAAFIEMLPSMVASERVDTGALRFDHAVALTDEHRDLGAGVGWKWDGEQFTDVRPKPEPAEEPTPEPEPAPAPTKASSRKK